MRGQPAAEPTDEFELEARRCGYRWIAGLDEAGRGPLAGPVVAAAVMLPRRFHLSGLTDSKQVTAQGREHLYEVIVTRAIGVGVGEATPQEIDAINILEATRLAMSRALAGLHPRPEWLLLDAVTLPGVGIPQRPIVKGDQLSLSIAAASIIAKVTRDRLMQKLHETFPQYNFRAHKGYATAEHLQALQQHGPCEIHRRSFAPVIDCIRTLSVARPHQEELQSSLFTGLMPLEIPEAQDR